MRNISVPKQASKISDKATELKGESTDNQTPLFSFRCVCKTHCQLSEWEKTEIKSLISTLQKVEGLLWRDIKKHQGLDYKPVDKVAYKLPSSVPPDATIEELKVNKQRRLVGYRSGRIFNLVWFDRVHGVCPEGKVARR